MSDKTANATKRRAETLSKIQLGALVLKARLGDMPKNALYGALLAIADQRHDDKLMAEYTRRGGAAFEREKADRVRVSIAFPDDHKPSDDVRKALRAYGCTWNRLREEWLASVFEPDAHHLSALVEQHGGRLTVFAKEAPKEKPAKVAVRVRVADGVTLDPTTLKRLKAYGIREAAPGVFLGVAVLGLVRAKLSGIRGVIVEAVQV